MGRNWELVTNRKPIFHELCSEASSKQNHYGDVAQMVERSLCMREVRGSMTRISKTFLRIRQFWFVFADNGNELTTRYKWKTDISWVLFKASSELEEYGDVAQMVERSLSMREVRERCPASPKHFWGFDNCFLFADYEEKLTPRYKWKLIFHELCSEASSKLEEYGDVAQMVERSLSMWEVRGSMPRISKSFLRIRQIFLFADYGEKLTPRYKWKLIFHELCSEARSERNHYGDVAQMVERSLCMREVRGSMPRIQNNFEDSITLICICW